MRFHGEALTAIVIDDDTTSVHLFRDVLEMIGVTVLASGYDGKAAVRLYEQILFLQT